MHKVARTSWTRVDLTQRSALMLAAEYGRTAMVRYLVETGAKVDARNNNKQSALDAIAKSDPELARQNLE